MARLRGFLSFVIIAGTVFGAVRLVHVGVPLVFPNTRSGPIAVASLDDVEQRLGFAPLIPAYRPEALGAGPTSMTVSFRPRPAFAIVWRQGDEMLSVTQWEGGPRPEVAPLSRPLKNVASSSWWTDASRAHLVVARDGCWITIETTLPPKDLPRLADTLTRYRRSTAR